MTTLPPSSPGGPHQARPIAEGFGTDAERYDRTRPRYPPALIDRIVVASPGPAVLDVGIGTGISAMPFRAAGCEVLGVDPDARMAELALRRGFAVEIAKFEDWDPAGRTFDAVIAGQTWHWVDPVAGAVKAAQVLRPGGRLAVFWNAMEPPAAIRDALVEAFREALAGTSFSRETSPGSTGYSAFFVQATNGIREAGAFGEPEQWQEDWERSYTKEEWLDQVPTGGGFNRLPPAKLAEVLGRVGGAIDALGGRFTVTYATVAVTAVRMDVA